jgi:hypothetical protein
VLDNTPANDDGTRVPRLHSLHVDSANVSYSVKYQWLPLVGVEKQHVAYRAVL